MPFCPTQEEIYGQILHLLPPGGAHQTDDLSGGIEESTLRSFWFAMAGVFYEADVKVCSTFAEFFCHSMVEDVDLWLEEYGLPDKCDPFSEDVCAKVAAAGKRGADLPFLTAIAARLGWDVTLEWLKGDHPSYVGVRSTILITISESTSAAALVTDLSNWELPDMALGDVATVDFSSLLCLIERALPAHIGIVYEVVSSFLSADEDDSEYVLLHF